MTTRSRRRKAQKDAERCESQSRTPMPYPDPTEAVIRRFDFEGQAFWTVEGSRIGVLMMAPEPSWPPEIHDAYMRRRDANLFGRCACGAVAEPYFRDARGMTHNRLEHEYDCPASDELFTELLEGWWRSAGQA